MSYIIDRQDNEFIKQINDSILDSLDKRFPDGVRAELALPLMEAMLEAYYNGARHAEALLHEEDQSVKAEAARLVL